MQDKFVITIADESGSRQFSLPRKAKKIIFSAILILAIVILSCFFLMRFLMQKIDNIILDKNIALSEYRYIRQKNDTLKDEIDQKNRELTLISQKIGELENIVDLKKNIQEVPTEKIDLQELSSSEKALLLSLIPSGEPLNFYSVRNLGFQKTSSIGANKLSSTGYDYITPDGTPVYASADGVIDLIGSGKSSYGRLIKITHSFGFSSLYAHLDKSLVKKGDFIQKGQLIGYSGRSGNVSEGTLYYEVRFLGKVLNPAAYVAWNTENFEEIFEDNADIDWKSLVWAIQDMTQLQSYKLTFQSNNLLNVSNPQ